MKQTRFSCATGACVLGLMVVGAACSSNDVSETGRSQARLRARLSGDPVPGRSTAFGRGPGGVQEVKVTISEVRAHGPAGWTTLRDGSGLEIDLMKLDESAADLGLTNVVGRVKQIRLMVEEESEAYVVTNSGDRHDLKIPSGVQSGLKLRGDWNVGACEDVEAEVTVDARSMHIHSTGRGDLYMLRPVLRSGRVSRTMIEDCDPAAEPSPNGPDSPNVPDAGTEDEDEDDDCDCRVDGGDDDEDDDHGHSGRGNDDEDEDEDEDEDHGRGHGDDDDDDHGRPGRRPHGDDPEVGPNCPNAPDDPTDPPTPTDPSTPTDPTPTDPMTPPTDPMTPGGPTTPTDPVGPGEVGAACESHDNCSMGLFCTALGTCAAI